MKLICKPRGCGKTYDLIMESARTGIPILVFNNPDFIAQQARRMGVKIPQPVNIKEYDTFRKNGSLSHGRNWSGKLLVDEIDLVLSRLLDADIEIATCTPNLINEKEDRFMETIRETKACETSNPMLFENNTNNKANNTKLSDIKDIDIVVLNKVVEVTFVDGLKEKMICHKDDTFNLRNCLFIAIAKHLYKKDYTQEGIEYIAYRLTHLKKYVKIVDSALKNFERKQKDIQKLEAEYKAEQERIKRKHVKRLAYKERKTATKREEQIEIQKEAYLRAMKTVKKFKKIKN